MPQNCCINTGFWNVDHFGDTQCVTKLEHNIKSFLDYSFLSIGGWVDVVPPGSFAELKCVVCPGYTCGQVWQTSRTNLIWETVLYTDKDGNTHSPIVPAFTPAPDSINYEAGQIIYGGALAEDAAVTGTFSARCVNVILGGAQPWWEEFDKGSFDESIWSIDKQAGCVIIGKNRVQLPAIVINGASGSIRPHGLGKCRMIKTVNVDLHVLAETKMERDKLLGILLSDAGTCKTLFDPDIAPCVYDCNGELQNPITYPELVEDYCWRGARLNSAEDFGHSFIECGLYEGIARHEYEVYL